MSRMDRMASDLSRAGPIERDIEQVIFCLPIRFLPCLIFFRAVEPCVLELCRLSVMCEGVVAQIVFPVLLLGEALRCLLFAVVNCLIRMTSATSGHFVNS